MTTQVGEKSPQIRFRSHISSWRTESVSSLLSERNFQAPKSDLYPLMAFIAGKGVAPKGVRYDREFLVSDGPNKKYKQTELGDFIYSSNNLETGSIGSNRYGKASISPVYSIFAPTIAGDPDFIEQLLCRKPFIAEMVKWRQGVVYGQWRIHETDFLRINATFPSLSEQRAIGGFLRKLDQLIGLYQQKHEKLVALKKAMLQKMLPNPDSKTPKIRFGGFSGDWVEAPLRELTSKIGSGKTPRGGSASYASQGVPLIRSQNIVDNTVNLLKCAYISSEMDEEMANSRVKAGDVLLNITGASIGRSAVYTCERLANVNQHVCIIRPVEGFDPKFIQVLLSSEIGQQKIFNNQAGGAREGLNFQQIGGLVFTYPGIIEQGKIGAYFHALNELILKRANQIQRLRQIKSACLEKMFV
ncbi:restriction endonuclease subunit S [Pseudomonas sp. zjy_9]